MEIRRKMRWYMFTRKDSCCSSTYLTCTGNLVLGDWSDSYVIWQSLYYPTDTWLPVVALTLDEYTFNAWRNFSDPAPRKFSFQITQNNDTEDPDV